MYKRRRGTIIGRAQGRGKKWGDSGDRKEGGFGTKKNVSSQGIYPLKVGYNLTEDCLHSAFGSSI